MLLMVRCFFFSSRRRHTRCSRDWSSDVCSSDLKPLSVAERRAIETFLAGAYDLDDVVLRTVRLLAQLTRQVAVVQYPSLTRSSVRHIELVPLTDQRLLLILITNTGRVEQ